MDISGGGVRNGILNLKLGDQMSLYRSYMSFVQGGGLFIPTAKNYMLGDEVFVLLELVGEPDKTPVTGKVVWVSPRGLGRGQSQGIGVQLAEKHSDLVSKIETHLAGLLESNDQTSTM